MTIQIRAKRRLLPKRSIVDIDYISPTQNVQDLLFTATPSKKDHGVICELHGNETNNQEQLPQVVLGKPKRSRLIDKETQWSDFFKQHSIIPTQKKKQEPKTTITKENSLDLQTENDEQVQNIQDEKNADQQVNAAQFVSKVTMDETVAVDTIDEDAVVKESINKQVIVKDALVEDDAVVKVAVIEKSKTKGMTTGVDEGETGSLSHKKVETEGQDVCSLKKKDDDEEEEAVVVIKTKKKKRREAESFMLPPNKVPKRIRSHETIHALKYSGALNWIINGKDTDPRKHDIGKVRKGQLEKRLHRPLAAKRVIRNKAEFIIQ